MSQLFARLFALPLAEQQRVQSILVQLQQHASPEQLVAALPEDFRAAMAHDDAEAAQSIFDAMSASEQDRVAHIMNLLQQAHAEADDSGELTISDVLENFDSLLQAIAAVALGNDEPRAEVEQILATVEDRGWRLSAATARIWAGERDATLLTADLDEQDAVLVMRTLAIIAESEE